MFFAMFYINQGHLGLRHFVGVSLDPKDEVDRGLAADISAQWLNYFKTNLKSLDDIQVNGLSILLWPPRLKWF